MNNNSMAGMLPASPTWLGALWSRARGRSALPIAGWHRVPSDAPGLQRWWDGALWTKATKWDFDEAVRANGKYFTHGSCTIRHRQSEAAAHCPGHV